jgi:toxin ParE1/3/4
LSSYRLGERAESDLAAIFDYTVDTWGEEQAVKYLAELTTCFELLTATPYLGRACDALSPGLRRIEQGKHVVFYRVAGGDILISRILHQGYLPGRHNFSDI